LAQAAVDHQALRPVDICRRLPCSLLEPCALLLSANPCLGMPAVGATRAAHSDQWTPPAGNWLTRSGGDGGAMDRDPLEEIAELGLDTRICGSVLSSLRHDPPPRYSDAQAEVAVAVARWDAQGDRVGRGARHASPSSAHNLRSRSGSRGPTPEPPARAVPGAAARPPLPLGTRPAAPSTLASAGGAAFRRPGPLESSSSCTVPKGPLPPPVAKPSSPSSCSNRPAASAAPLCGKSDDGSLVSSMAARLSQVEQLNKHQSAKLAQQAQEIGALQTELETLKGSKAQSNHGVEGVSAVYCSSQSACTNCARLSRQVEDMTQFLADYGLTWVPNANGAQDNCDDGVGDRKRGDSSPSVSSNTPIGKKMVRPTVSPGGVAVDIEVIKSRVESLNAMIESDRSKVEKDLVGGKVQARLVDETAMPSPLTFFCDGLKVSDYAFLPYDSHTAQDVLKDILDGYFPRTLAKEHPNGIALKVIDRTGNAFQAWLREFARDDPDLIDGGSRLRPPGGRAVRAPADEMSAGERLLAKLPERVVKDGRVCEVRGPIAQKLGAVAGVDGHLGSRRASAPPPLSKGDSGGEISLLDTCREPTAPTARLQVKLEGGQKIVLCMEPHATIGALWDALAQWRADNGVARAGAGGKQCCLRTAFPSRVFTDFGQSLEAAGLTPSATLFVSVEASRD